MPRRKLPFSDNHCIFVLDKLLETYQALVINKPDPAQREQAVSEATYNQVLELLPGFKTKVAARSDALGHQTDITKITTGLLRDLRMTVRHFLMILNLAIDRRKITPSVRPFFGLDAKSRRIPIFSSHEATRKWAGQVVSGEAERIAAGGVPLQNPSSSEVKELLDEYDEHRSIQIEKKNAYDDSQAEVEKLRVPVKTLIRESWEEIAFYYRREPVPSRRRKERLWGVYYKANKNTKPEEEEG